MIGSSSQTEYACDRLNYSVKKLLSAKFETREDYCLLESVLERIQLANLHKTPCFHTQQLFLQLLKINADEPSNRKIKNVVSRIFGNFITFESIQGEAFRVDFGTLARHSEYFKRFFNETATHKNPPTQKLSYSSSILDFSLSFLLDTLSPTTLKKGEFELAFAFLNALTLSTLETVMQPLPDLLNQYPGILGPAIWEENGWKEELYNIEVVHPYQIQKLLAANCPLFQGEKIANSHLLIWLPDNLTIEKLLSLAKRVFPKNPRGFSAIELAGKPFEADLPGIKAHWIIMTKKIVPQSIETLSATPHHHIERSFLGFGQLPTVLEATSSILMHYLSTGERLFENSFTLCQNIEGQVLAIGGFNEEGIQLLDSKKASPLGYALMRRL